MLSRVVSDRFEKAKQETSAPSISSRYARASRVSADDVNSGPALEPPQTGKQKADGKSTGRKMSPKKRNGVCDVFWERKQR